MKIFVAGGTGVLGRASVKALVEGGHPVRSTARTEEKAELVRNLGAEPVQVDLYDPKEVRRAISGSEAVLRLTTKIPPIAKMRSFEAWQETNLLRTEGARILVDAAIAEGVQVYVHESITFVYADAGTQWITEDSPTDPGESEILRSALDGEKEAARFSEAGGRGIVLRFGSFYGVESNQTADMVSMMRRRLMVQPGRGSHYISSIYIPDAGTAVLASLKVPAGTYNVVDENPVSFKDYLQTLASAVHVPKPFRFPGALGKVTFGDVWSYISRSQRVSNARFKKASGWKPSVASVAEGWPLVAAALKPATRARAQQPGSRA
ncbi:MAG: NAD-dependent epimerase/dehydratase family protein [Acidobacteria bacterium]|nr:MAG: NAD-dependent epimerase/dehydratase family protein [Acidobacteriota bacterium]